MILQVPLTGDELFQILDVPLDALFFRLDAAHAVFRFQNLEQVVEVGAEILLVVQSAADFAVFEQIGQRLELRVDHLLLALSNDLFNQLRSVGVGQSRRFRHAEKNLFQPLPLVVNDALFLFQRRLFRSLRLNRLSRFRSLIRFLLRFLSQACRTKPNQQRQRDSSI